MTILEPNIKSRLQRAAAKAMVFSFEAHWAFIPKADAFGVDIFLPMCLCRLDENYPEATEPALRVLCPEWKTLEYSSDREGRGEAV
jgi:hypothetical protein